MLTSVAADKKQSDGKRGADDDYINPGATFRCACRHSGSTSSVRLIPSGVSSNAQAIMSAIGNPIATKTITNRTTQFGISRNGKTCVAI